MNLAPTAVSYPWFALQTRCRYESFVAKQLAHKGYEILLPLYECRRRWSDRIKELELPLFPGYVFCRFNPLVRLPILMTPGVIQVVGIGRSPVPVDDAEIAAIQTAVQSPPRLVDDPSPALGGRRSGRCVGDLHSPAASGLRRSGILSACQPTDQENHRRSDYQKPWDSIDNLKSLAALIEGQLKHRNPCVE